MPSSAAEAYLVALCIESIVYGIHGVTFISCMRIWLRRSKRPSLPGSTSWPWVPIATALFALGTLHLALTCYDNIWAFILYQGNDGPEGVLEVLFNWVSGTRVSDTVLWFPSIKYSYHLQLVCTHLVTTMSDAALVMGILHHHIDSR